MLFTGIKMQAQPPAFYHLSTAEGLSDNNVNSVARDRNGILWIGTTEGLNSFDGHRISTWHRYNAPALADNNIDKVVIDDSNRIWLRTNTNRLNMMDEKRRLHLFMVGDTADKARVTLLLPTHSKGIIALKGKQHYTWKNKHTLIFEKWEPDFLKQFPVNIRFMGSLDGDKIIVHGDKRLLVIDYASEKILADIPVPVFMGATYINADELLAYPISGDVFYRISISQQKIIKEYRGLKDQQQKPVAGNLRYIARINENNFVITTRFSGLYYLDLANGTIRHWVHDPLDQRSIGGNNTFWITYDTSGYLFITTQTSGLHYYNTRQQQAFSRPYFTDAGREVFDGYIQSITTGKDNTIWMGTQDRLVRWNRQADQAVYVPCYLPDGTNISREETIRALHLDEEENLWVGTSRYGVLILDKQLKTIRRFSDSLPDKKTNFPSNWINTIQADSKGNKWVGTIGGTCMIEKGSLKVLDFNRHPVLNKISKLSCASLFEDSRARMWIGTTSGAWCFDEKTMTLQQYDKEKGLPHNTVLAINEDDKGNIYFGTSGGLTILSQEGTVKSYNRSNGLRNDRCEGILKDEKGFIWIGNLNCILRYDPVSGSFAVFEEGMGFSHAGFRMRSCHKTAFGEMIWGSDKGLVYFFPDQMSRNNNPLHPAIHSLQTADSAFYFTGASSLSFAYNESSFTFYFTSGDIAGGKKNQFLYKLNGFDENWNKPVAPGQATYNRLPPGNYSFEIKASPDGNTWYTSLYNVTINIGNPWWQQTWFRILYSLLALLAVIGVYRYYKKRKQVRETKQMIEYFANSRYEHSSVDDILWDISRNCISRLGFEDCVIYLADEERKVMVQKAAYGPKNPKAFEITNPIEIPFGKGVVGDVAVSGKASVIDDTSKDKRYIVDDEQRFAEMTVPIIHEGKVIGIIDSENSKKNFFNSRHLNILETIANLCSAKISSAQAMEAMKKSRLEVMELNVKMAESKFSNLRLQMNPHFLFNSLSSIQHLIVSQQTTRAYKYLTVFSNFLRSLLNYAEKNFIPLDEELKILEMYIELEALRFDQSFTWEIKTDEHLANDEVLVPTLMIQPFVENAIWHGLLHKTGEKKLLISFQNSTEEFLTCTVEDNGVGRAEATRIRQNKITSMVHESKGIGIIRERLQLLEQKTGKPARLEVNDLYDQQQQATGTKVIITIPYYNPEKI